MANRANPDYPQNSTYPYLDDQGNPTLQSGLTAEERAAPSPSVGEPAANAATNTQPAQVSNPAPAQQTTTPTTTTAVPNVTQQDQAYQQLVQQARDDLTQARTDVLTIQSQIDDTNAKLTATPGGLNTPAGQQLQNTLNTLYQSQAQANLKVAQMSESFASVATKAIDSASLTGVTADKARAEADLATAQSEQARAQADSITKGSASQIALASAQASLAAANANAQIAKTPDEQRQLQAQATSLNAQANLYGAQVDKEKEAGRLTGAQADIAEANAATAGRAAEASTTLLEQQALEAKNKVQGLPTAEQQGAINQALVGQQQATVGLTQAQAAAQTATAKSTEAQTQQKLLGPTYGLQDQIDAIRKIQQNVFGPGGSGNPQDADNMLQQFFTATVAGTTPFEAAKAAATQQGLNYGTQMQGVDTLQQAMASRANQYLSTAGTALGQMASLNAYAPRGSTAGAAAYQEVLDQLAQRVAQPQFAPVQLPQAPQLPQFLQAFTAGNNIGQQQGAMQARQQQGPPGGQQPTINVNVNGQPAAGPMAGGGFNPQGSTAAMNQAGYMDSPQGRAALAQAFGNGVASTPPPTSINTPMTAQGTGQYTPSSIQTTPATGPQTSAPSFLSNLPPVPQFAMNYLGLQNPMNMLRGF